MAQPMTAHRLPITVRAGSARSGPATLGQRNVLAWIALQDGERSDVDGCFADVPPGTGVDGVADAMRVLITRHEALRTTFARHEGSWVQQVAAEGEILAELHELGDEPTQLYEVEHTLYEHRRLDPDFRMRLLERMCAEPFDLTREWGVRLGVVTRRGEPVLAIVVLSHVVADFAAIQLVEREFTALLATSPRVPGPPRHQPLDQAAAEATAPARRRAEGALRHWEAHLRRAPQSMFAIPPHPDGVPGQRMGLLRSPAAAMALTNVVARTGVSHSTVLLATGMVLLTHVTATPAALFVSICANRFRPREAGHVSNLAQAALVSFETGSSTLDEVIRRARQATMTAYHFGGFDPDRLYDVMDRVADERGTRFHRDCDFNDISVHREPRRTSDEPFGPDELRRATSETEVDVRPGTVLPVLFRLKPLEVHDRLLLGVWADTRYLPEPEIARFLLGVERLLLAAAERDVASAEFTAISGLTPVRRPGGWYRVDSCWIELSACQTLIEEIETVRTGHVVVENHRGEPRLVAYLVPDSPSVTPREIHTACVGRLYRRFTTMAPQWYVLCADAPADPADADAWRARPRLAEGSGRPGVCPHAGPDPRA
ncbi:MAG TPA: condensation domain-containing protein [Amycolatopsis sp.]|nr:condensation domain-containing protein [Amycolatopsis sp.]